MIFPNGIVINPVEREYRTSDLNPIFRLIHSFTGDDGSINEKRTGRNTDPSRLVDNLLEISNISITPRDFELTIQGVKFITEKIKLLSD